MISAYGLSILFEGRRILDRVSFVINPGDKVGMVGINGSGKTTILKTLIGEVTPDSGDIVISKKVHKISYVPQKLTFFSNQSDLTVLSFMLEGRKLLAIKRRMDELEALIDQENNQSSGESLLDEYLRLQEEFNVKEGYRAQEDIRKILEGLGVGNMPLVEKVITLSGGQKTRLALARMLYEDSDVLILDEPTNHIDEESVKWFTEYLSKIRKTVLVVSHLPDFLDKVVNRIFLMEDGHLKSYPGNFSKFVGLRKKESETALRSTEKLLAEIERHKRFIRNASQRKSKMKHSREKLVERLEKRCLAPVKQARRIKFQLPLRVVLRSPVLSVQSVFKNFGKRKILEGISFEVGPMEKLGIMGENGAGKTTLLKIVANELQPSRGRIALNSKAEIGWYRQEQEGLDDKLFVLEEVRRVGDIGTQTVRSALAHFLFYNERMTQKVGTLSRGERARLALCKIMLSGSNFLLLDEPTNHLDQLSRDSLIQALSTYKGAILVVSHDQVFLRGIGVLWSLKLPQGEMVRID